MLTIPAPAATTSTVMKAICSGWAEGSIKRVEISRRALAAAVASGRMSSTLHSVPQGLVMHSTPANPISTDIHRHSELASRRRMIPSRVTMMGEVQASAAAVGSAMNCNPKSHNPVDINSQPPRTSNQGCLKLGTGMRWLLRISAVPRIARITKARTKMNCDGAISSSNPLTSASLAVTAAMASTTAPAARALS